MIEQLNNECIRLRQEIEAKENKIGKLIEDICKDIEHTQDKDPYNVCALQSMTYVKERLEEVLKDKQ